MNDVLKKMSQAEQKQVEQQINALAKYVSTNFPEGAQFAIVTAGANSKHGCFWGFSDVRTLRNKIEAIKQEPSIQVRRLANEACLIEIKPDRMLQILNAANPNLFTAKDCEDAKQMMQEAEGDFIKYMLTNGKKSPDKQNNTIGIYCTNDVTTIKHKGQSYPAFRVNLETALRYMDQYQYGIVVDNKVITARQVVSMGPSVYEKFTLSPTKTGIFVQVKPLQNSLFYNNVEKQLKGKM